MDRSYVQNEKNQKELKMRLKSAEDFVTNGDFHSALNTYKALGDMFIHDYDEFHFGAYFFKKCISISRQIKDKDWESLAKMGFAKCHDKLDRPDDAIELLEDAVEKAASPQIMSQVSTELVSNYKKMAERYELCSEENQSQIQLALSYYEKCLQACQRAEMIEIEGQISHKIGMIYLKHGDYEKSIEHQKIYLANAMQLDDKSKKNEMDAHASLAQCYTKINDIENAQKHLEQYFDKSKTSVNRASNAHADAAHHLADLWWKKKNIEGAQKYYKLYFESARTVKENEHKDRRLIDNARIALGLAKGTTDIDNYMEMITDSKDTIQPLLDWKMKKEKS